MRRSRVSGSASDALKLFGASVRLARKERRWTVEELAERVGVSPVTLRKVERGDPTVALGTAFEAATLVGVPLYSGDPMVVAAETDRIRSRIALLPERVRRHAVDDDF